jgi:hypothetical protein
MFCQHFFRYFDPNQFGNITKDVNLKKPRENECRKPQDIGNKALAFASDIYPYPSWYFAHGRVTIVISEHPRCTH